MDETAFYKKYWFNHLQMVTVVNNTSEDHEFDIMLDTKVNMDNGQMMTEKRHYVVRAGETVRLPGVPANLYLDQMVKKQMQENDEVAQMADFAARAKYYDDLIVGVDDMLDAYAPAPQYLQEEAKTTIEPDKIEQPFADLKAEEPVNEQPITPEKRDTGAREKVSTRSEAVAKATKSAK